MVFALFHSGEHIISDPARLNVEQLILIENGAYNVVVRLLFFFVFPFFFFY